MWILQYTPTPHPQVETARPQSELFTFQCSQWELIWNSQLIGRYKEMSVWHKKNIMIPPLWNCQSTEWTLHFSMWSMIAHLKQSTNRNIYRNVTRWILCLILPEHRVNSLLFNAVNVRAHLNSQLIGRYKDMSPGESYIWNCQST